MEGLISQRQDKEAREPGLYGKATGDNLGPAPGTALGSWLEAVWVLTLLKKQRKNRQDQIQIRAIRESQRPAQGGLE